MEEKRHEALNNALGCGYVHKAHITCDPLLCRQLKNMAETPGDKLVPGLVSIH